MLIKDLKEPGRIIAPDESKKLKSGLVVLRPGESVGSHTTADREEIIIVLEGEATVEDEGATRLVIRDQLAYIAPERRHNVRNASSETLRYLYIVTPV
jgi:quercetin dioxygenase-like cupin family protein